MVAACALFSSPWLAPLYHTLGKNKLNHDNIIFVQYLTTLFKMFGHNSPNRKKKCFFVLLHTGKITRKIIIRSFVLLCKAIIKHHFEWLWNCFQTLKLCTQWTFVILYLTINHTFLKGASCTLLKKALRGLVSFLVDFY